MRLLASMLLVLAIGCGGHDSTSEPNVVPSVAIIGTWTLRTIGGAVLPFVLDQAGEDRIELMEASIVTTTAGQFTTTSLQRTTIAGSATSQSFSEGGSYTLNGASVSFTFSSDNAVVTGTIAGDSLTFTGGGIPVVYRRKP